MSKESFIKGLRSSHPDKQDELYVLAWILQSWDKATVYAQKLSVCTDYDMLARVVKQMQEENPQNIYPGRATKEKDFLNVLIPLCCLPEDSNAHAANQHIRPLINGKKKAKQKHRDNVEQIADLLRSEFAADNNDFIHVRIDGYWPKSFWQQLMANGENVTVKYFDDKEK